MSCILAGRSAGVRSRIKTGMAIGVAIAGLVLSACQTIGNARDLTASLAIQNVTVIDPETRQSLPARTVYVDGDRIVAIRRARKGDGNSAARTIDGTGKFLIPGLMDMHVHLFLPEPAAPTLNLLLANGVTGIREMSSDCWAAAGAKKGCVGDYRALQQSISSGQVPGPEIMSLTSTMVMGPTRLKLPKGSPGFITPRTEEDAKVLIRHLQSRGVDLIKTHDSIPAAPFAALMSEAAKLNISVGGHVPFGAGTLGAVRMGYHSIEHARDLLYDCSRYGPAFRSREAAFAEERPGSVRPPNVERLTRTVAEFDPAICQSVLKQVSASNAYYVPTHVTREMEAKVDDTVYRSQIPRQYVLADRNKRWEGDLTETAALPPAERAALRDFYLHGLRITGLAHRVGIPIMAGTDANDTMIVPGFSLHRELALLVEAGLSPMDALRAATTVPARYYGKSSLLGGVAAGKEADLVLLDANPVTDIANARRVSAVIANGRIYDRIALDRLLAEVEAMAKPT